MFLVRDKNNESHCNDALRICKIRWWFTAIRRVKNNTEASISVAGKEFSFVDDEESRRRKPGYRIQWSRIGRDPEPQFLHHENGFLLASDGTDSRTFTSVLDVSLCSSASRIRYAYKNFSYIETKRSSSSSRGPFVSFFDKYVHICKESSIDVHTVEIEGCIEKKKENLTRAVKVLCATIDVRCSIGKSNYSKLYLLSLLVSYELDFREDGNLTIISRYLIRILIIFQSIGWISILVSSYFVFRWYRFGIRSHR